MELKEYKERLNLEKETERKEAVEKFLSLMVDMKIDLGETERIIINRKWSFGRSIVYYPCNGDKDEIKITKEGKEEIMECKNKTRSDLKKLLRIERNRKHIESIGATIKYFKNTEVFSETEKWVIDCTNIK